MSAIIGRLREQWAAARDRRKSKRRERANKHVEARADRDRYDPHRYEGGGGGGGDGGRRRCRRHVSATRPRPVPSPARGRASRRDLAEQLAEEPGRVLVRERGERDRRAAPAGASFQQLRACGADDQERQLVGATGQELDEVEQRVVGPVDVLEDQDRRVITGQGLEEPAPGLEGLPASAVQARRRVSLQADQRAQVLGHPGAVALVGHQRVDGLGELRPRHVDAVGLEDAGLGLDHLAERPERDALAVGERAPAAIRQAARAAPPRGPPARSTSRVLPIPGSPISDTSCVRRLGAGAVQLRHQQAPLAVTPDEAQALGPRLLGHGRARRDGAPHRNRLGLALGGQRLVLGVADRAARPAVGGLVDEHAADGRGGLQPGRRVDDVADGIDRSVVAEGDERLSARHADTHSQRVSPCDPLADLERRPDRPLRIVLVRGRRAEQRHHAVAHELADGAAVLLDRRLQGHVIRREQLLHVLDVQALGPAREADQVGEEHRDDAPLLTKREHEASLRLCLALRPQGITLPESRATNRSAPWATSLSAYRRTRTSSRSRWTRSRPRTPQRCRTRR